jgi:hypothetical protein
VPALGVGSSEFKSQFHQKKKKERKKISSMINILEKGGFLEKYTRLRFLNFGVRAKMN